MRRVERVIFAIGGAVAASRILLALRRLLFPVHEYDGGDLLLRWQEVHSWFVGLPVYGVIGSADYPPASYTMFWPFIGWSAFGAGRWIWAGLTLLMLAWLIRILARETADEAGPLRAAILLVPIAGYASYATIANGQVGILAVTVLTAGVILLARGQTVRDDVAGSALVAASLIKPTLTVPLVWVAFLVPKRLRPAVLIVGGYLGLTLVAAAFQPVGPVALLRGWLDQSEKVNLGASGLNLQRILASAGFDHLFLPAAIAACAITGLWVFRHRRTDVWLLLGVTAFVALLLTYHRPFDDVLLFLPMVALLRVAGRTEGSTRIAATALGWGLVIVSITHPQTRLITHGLVITDIESIVFAADNVRTAVWLATIAFLVRQAWLDAHPRETPVTGGASADPSTSNGLDASSAVPPGKGWIAVCFAFPAAVLVTAFVWLAVDHGTVSLWRTVVHENGTYTFGETVFYLRHFLREIPTVAAMALFVIAACAGPPAAAPGARNAPTAWIGGSALAAGGLLVCFAIAYVASRYGAGEAARNLVQSYTRDDVIAYGSHWRFHWLSTLWFGLAAVATAHVGGRFGGPASAGPRSAPALAAWAWFVALTVLFGMSLEPFVDARFIGHQAREILTHALVSLPLGLGAVAAVDRVGGFGTRRGARRIPMAVVAGLLAIPAFLGIGVFVADSMAAGQTAGGLAAMVGAHSFEHFLDYVLLVLLVGGGRAVQIGWRTAARPHHAAGPGRNRIDPG